MPRKKAANPWTPKRLKALRKMLELTQAQAAERMDVSLDTWRSWEMGRRQPSATASRLLGLLAAGKLD